MKKNLIFDLDGTLIDSGVRISEEILKYFKEHKPEYYDNAAYALQNSLGLSLQEILLKVFNCNDASKFHADKLYNILAELRDEVDFFPGVPEKILELSKDYKLYISTGNSDSFAKTTMEIARIKNCFEIIMGSSSIIKSAAHLEIFAAESDDPHFYQKSVYIGDGDRDREIAESKGMDFIRIGKNSTDKYCIDSVIDINNVLDILNND